MKTVEVKCTICPNECLIKAQVEDDEVMDVDGNRCMRGFASAQRYVLEHLDEL